MRKGRPSWYYEQSGVIPYRRTRDNDLEVLLVTSRRGRRWIIPKGIIDPGNTPLESACKEAYEEAGIRGRPTPSPLGKYRYDKWGGTCTVTVYALEVSKMLTAWPEKAIRQRRWMSVKDAARTVREGALRKLIRNIARF